jgi:uncharacterized protein with PQ loop repeat
MIQLIGWMGASLFAICSLPQAIKIHRTKSANDISWLFLIAWFWGEILSAVYLVAVNLQTGKFQYPILFNYAASIIILCYIIAAKYFYEHKAIK